MLLKYCCIQGEQTLAFNLNSIIWEATSSHWLSVSSLLKLNVQLVLDLNSSFSLNSLSNRNVGLSFRPKSRTTWITFLLLRILQRSSPMLQELEKVFPPPLFKKWKLCKREPQAREEWINGGGEPRQPDWREGSHKDISLKANHPAEMVHLVYWSSCSLKVLRRISSLLQDSVGFNPLVWWDSSFLRIQQTKWKPMEKERENGIETQLKKISGSSREKPEASSVVLRYKWADKIN